MVKRGLHSVAIPHSCNVGTGVVDKGMAHFQEDVAHTGVAFG